MIKGKLFKLSEPLYGLLESKDYWSITFRKYLSKDIGSNAFISDPTMCYKHLGQKRMGMRTSYVDDTLHSRTKQYSEDCKIPKMRLKCKPQELHSTNSTGLSISNHKNDYIIQYKKQNSRLKLLDTFINFSHFQSLRARLSWAKKLTTR